VKFQSAELTLALWHVCGHASVTGLLMLPVLNRGTVSQPSSISQTLNLDSSNSRQFFFLDLRCFVTFVSERRV